MINRKKKRVNMSISIETKGLLDSIKHTGQSYNGLIMEMALALKKEQEKSGNSNR